METSLEQKGSILIVDDEAGPRESLRMILKSTYKIHTATNGEQALQCIQNGNIDLVTLDLNMPGLPGFEVLKEMKKVNTNVVVVVITGHGSMDNAYEAFQLGAAEFISKPFEVDQIIAITRKYIGHEHSKPIDDHEH